MNRLRLLFILLLVFSTIELPANDIKKLRLPILLTDTQNFTILEFPANITKMWTNYNVGTEKNNLIIDNATIEVFENIMYVKGHNTMIDEPVFVKIDSEHNNTYMFRIRGIDKQLALDRDGNVTRDEKIAFYNLIKILGIDYDPDYNYGSDGSKILVADFSTRLKLADYRQQVMLLKSEFADIIRYDANKYYSERYPSLIFSILKIINHEGHTYIILSASNTSKNSYSLAINSLTLLQYKKKNIFKKKSVHDSRSLPYSYLVEDDLMIKYENSIFAIALPETYFAKDDYIKIAFTKIMKNLSLKGNQEHEFEFKAHNFVH